MSPMQRSCSQIGSEVEIWIVLKEGAGDLFMAVSTGDVQGIGNHFTRRGWRRREQRTIRTITRTPGLRCIGNQLAIGAEE